MRLEFTLQSFFHHPTCTLLPTKKAGTIVAKAETRRFNDAECVGYNDAQGLASSEEALLFGMFYLYFEY